MGAIKPLVLVNLTNLRVLRGQSVTNSADLVVARNKFGLIYIPSTSIKGSFRSNLLLRGVEEGIVDLLFGSAVDSGETHLIKGHIGLIGFSDAYPVFFPVPSTRGQIYITSPLLLSKLHDALGMDSNILVQLQEKLSDDAILLNESRENELVDIAGGITLRALSGGLVESYEEFLVSLLNQAKLSEILNSTIGIINDNIIDIVLNKGLILRPGIKIEGFSENKDLYNKVVSKEGPRFEEEVPLGTIFITKIFVTREDITISEIVEKENIKKLQKLLESELVSSVEIRRNGINEAKIIIKKDIIDQLIEKSRSLFVGSKETLVKGLIKVISEIPPLSINEKVLIETREKPVRIRKKYIRIDDIRNLVVNALGSDNRTAEIALSLQKKVVGLPERFRTMDPITVLYFYSKIKENAKGKGWDELRKVAENVLKENSLDNVEINDDGYISSGQDKYLGLIDFLVRVFTITKYIIRAYDRRGENE